MDKYPWMQFFSGDWLKDPSVSKCSPVTRGIWIDFLCVMHESDRSGVITGTREQLARLGRCSAVELAHAIEDLTSTSAADVTERNGFVTVVNRRMNREFKQRKNNTLRQSRHRGNGACNGDVTPQNLEVRSQKSEYKPDKAYKGSSKLPKEAGEIARRFEALLGMQWVNDAGKWINRIKENKNRCERVVAEIENAKKEGRINTTPAQYAEQIWKEFK